MSSLAGMPRSVLLALTACTLLAHLWVLTAAPRRLRVRSSDAVPTFTLRQIDPPAVTPPAAALPPVATPRRPTAHRTSKRPVDALQLAASAGPSVGDPVEAGASPVAAAPAAEARLAPVSVPAPVALHYDVTALVRGRQLQGTSELQWRHDGERYEAVFELAVPALPPRRQHSAGQLAASGLAPQRYAETSRGEQATHFERAGQRLIFSNNRPPARLDAGAQDRLSILLQLAALLAGDPQRYPPGTEIAIQTATTREAGVWLFTVEGEESLQLPAGDMTTVKLVRAPRGDYEPRMEVWLGPGAAYAPVRLRLTQPNGDWVDHQWSATDRR